ncbi:hypothetical protein IHV12_20230 [Fictibacillus sp. 7GRE50]|uniref:hypothetical protein n=1 Tax=Fictibacillus sp. 7GRE50 TaxID=2745878 RepID=UPI0018CDE1BD|nr:hypothetical protein [Fictibacillus sp. 7GRE50]MBH0167255.1 hypothetical protein [Fictibacillus sp. 7GRE50]
MKTNLPNIREFDFTEKHLRFYEAANESAILKWDAERIFISLMSGIISKKREVTQEDEKKMSRIFRDIACSRGESPSAMWFWTDDMQARFDEHYNKYILPSIEGHTREAIPALPPEYKEDLLESLNNLFKKTKI